MSFVGCVSFYALDLLILPPQRHGISFLLTDYSPTSHRASSTKSFSLLMSITVLFLSMSYEQHNFMH